MSNQLFPCLTPEGSPVLPTNGIFYTASMAVNPAQNCQVYIEFFSDAEGTVPATPTGGVIQVQGSPMGNNWLSPSNVPQLNATSVGTPVSGYTPPYFHGRMTQGRVGFSGVTGAPYARVTFWRY